MIRDTTAKKILWPRDWRGKIIKWWKPEPKGGEEAVQGKGEHKKPFQSAKKRFSLVGGEPREKLCKILNNHDASKTRGAPTP